MSKPTPAERLASAERTYLTVIKSWTRVSADLAAKERAIELAVAAAAVAVAKINAGAVELKELARCRPPKSTAL